MNDKKYKKVVFVCTGNTCRSAMAELMFKKMVKGAQKECAVLSCGTFASNGVPMMENAKKALEKMGYDAPQRYSKSLDSTDFENALTVCMTGNHKRTLTDLGEEAYTLDELANTGEISDPYGSDLKIYLDIAKEIEAGLKVILDKFI